MLEIAKIRVRGRDAAEFLQGQLSNDLARLDTAGEIRAAWCNPKGRVLWFGPVTAIEDGFELAAIATIARSIVERLQVFRFRAKVEFDVLDDGSSMDPEIQIDAGCPWIGPAQFEQFTPHMLNLDLLDAISLDKGCYTGQEIVARTHYKGASKRRTLRFDAAQPVAEGSKVLADERAVGEVLNVADRKLLAVVPLARASERLHVDGVVLTPVPLPYSV